MKQEIEVAGAARDLRLRPYEHHAQYYETDQMGIIHHSNYVRWMEEARMDLMDQIGLNYKQMEEMEIISPVLSVSVEYHSMVHFDDTVVIQTTMDTPPKLILSEALCNILANGRTDESK